jgi:hypothetical protein
MAEPTTQDQERAQEVVDALFDTSMMLPVRAALVGAMAGFAAAARDEQRARYESALWVAGAFVEVYEGRVLDKPRADKLLRELGIRRWPGGSVDEPTAARRGIRPKLRPPLCAGPQGHYWLHKPLLNGGSRERCDYCGIPKPKPGGTDA